MADLEEILRKQAEAARLAEKLQGEKDPERILALAEQVLGKTRELEKMALGLAASVAPQDQGFGEVRVLLTPDQRKRIAEQTGVGIEAVTLRDTQGRSWNSEMPTVEPRVIEKLAAKEAAASRLTMETRSHVEKIVKQLKALNVPELEDTIRQLEKDPTLGLGRKNG